MRALLVGIPSTDADRADQLILDHDRQPAGNDIERATEMARRMVCEFGMSQLGPLTFGKKDQEIFLGREIAQHRDYSEDTAIKIDQEVRRFVDEGYARAKSCLVDGREVLVRVTHSGICGTDFKIFSGAIPVAYRRAQEFEADLRY